MKRSLNAVLTEYNICLRIFLRKRIASKAVMFKKVLQIHSLSRKFCIRAGHCTPVQVVFQYSLVFESCGLVLASYPLNANQ